jgi:uncharacterized membrane protein YhaH (DUF805 family)
MSEGTQNAPGMMSLQIPPSKRGFVAEHLWFGGGIDGDAYLVRLLFAELMIVLALLLGTWADELGHPAVSVTSVILVSAFSLSAYLAVVSTCKRLSDVAFSPFWVFALLIPFGGIMFMCVLIFFPGKNTRSENL